MHQCRRTSALFFPCHSSFFNGFQTNDNKQKLKLTVKKRMLQMLWENVLGYLCL